MTLASNNDKLRIVTALQYLHRDNTASLQERSIVLFEHKATPAEYKAGLRLAIDRGLLLLHESGTYVKFTQAGAEMFA